jgi:hypothetical protein
MTSCLLPRSGQQHVFRSLSSSYGLLSHYGRHNATTAVHHTRLGPESERSQRRWPESCSAEAAPHQEPSQISRRLFDVQDAQSESEKSNFVLQKHSCSQDPSQCCEKKPRCNNCVKMGDECVYGVAPERQQQQTLVRLQSPQLSTTGFTLRDLRFFHSFITASYPSFPFETDRAWTCEIPIIAQQVGGVLPRTIMAT